MHVKVDISEHVRFQNKVSVLGVATDDEQYSRHVTLYPRVKSRIDRYSGKWTATHAALCVLLLEEDLHKYASIQFCIDVGKSDLRNLLNRAFKNNADWKRLLSSEGIRVRAVGKSSYVDQYVKKVRKNHQSANCDGSSCSIDERELRATLKSLGSTTECEEETRAATNP